MGYLVRPGTTRRNLRSGGEARPEWDSVEGRLERTGAHAHLHQCSTPKFLLADAAFRLVRYFSWRTLSGHRSAGCHTSEYRNDRKHSLAICAIGARPVWRI